MSAEKIRRSLENYRRALSALSTSLQAPITEARDRSGIIKDFEISYELAWKLLQGVLVAQGHAPRSARHAIELAFELGWLKDEDAWLGAIRDRNLTVHTYNEALAEAMVERISARYLEAFVSLGDTASGLI